MSVGELSSLRLLLSSVLLLPPSLSFFWLSDSEPTSTLKTQREAPSGRRRSIGWRFCFGHLIYTIIKAFYCSPHRYLCKRVDGQE